MTKKRLLMLLGSVCLALMMVAMACAGPAPVPTPSPTPSPSPSPTQTPSPSPTEEVYEWRMQSSYPPGDAVWDVQMPILIKYIEEATKGRVKITTYPPESLCGVMEMYDAVSKGVFESAIGANFIAQGVIPELVLVMIPFAWQSSEEAWELWAKRGLNDLVRGLYAEHNIHWLTTMPCGELLWFTKDPILSVDFFQGRKSRCYGMLADMVAELGGTPVGLPGGEIYMGMKLGVIDAFVYSVAELETLAFKEVIDYVNYPAMAWPTNLEFWVNTDAWEALPEDLQEAIDTALGSEDYYFETADSYHAWDLVNLEKAFQYGVKVNVIPEAEIAKMMKVALELWDEQAKISPECASGFDIIKQYNRELGRID